MNVCMIRVKSHSDHMYMGPLCVSTFEGGTFLDIFDKAPGHFPAVLLGTKPTTFDEMVGQYPALLKKTKHDPFLLLQVQISPCWLLLLVHHN